MKKILTTMVVSAMFAGAAVPAMAQEGVAKPVGLSIRAGLFFPTDRGVRDVSDAWAGGGVDYRLPYTLGAMNSDSYLSVSLDYASKGDYRVVPVLLNYVVRKGAAYAFAGAGISFSRRPVGADFDDKIRFGYQGGIGFDIHQGEHPIFVEGKFLGNDISKLNGFGVYLGFRL